MRKLHTDKKRLVPLILCSVLVLQQSFMNQANASNITDGNGNPINPHPGTGHYEIRPDAFNDKKVGFKEFQNLQLSEGDIMNFIFQWYNQEYGGDPAHNRGDIDTFVNFVNNRVEINGIVNALTQLGGQIKDNGNLVFISPNGMVVGSSGVLNVGSLQVLTPTQDSFNALKSGIPVADIDSTTNMSLSQQISKEWDPNAVVLGNGNITIDGRILARHDAELSGGNINMGSGGILLAGVGNQTEMLTDKAAADTLFQSLVNADNMNIANGFANNNGKIIITSNKGTNFEAGSKVKNFGMLSETTITNTGSEGVRIAGEVSNPNGTLSVTNKAGGINIESTATLKNKGEMVITGQDADTGIIINGILTNDGNLTITENTTSGTTGIEVGGNITNDTGVTTITNTQSGGLSVTSSGNITSNGTDLDMTNNGTDGFIIDGMVNNNAGVADLVNNQNTFDINGNVISAGDELNISNNGDNGLNIEGLVHNQNGVADILNNAGGLNVETTGQVTNDGSALTMTNSGDKGFTVDGSINNNNGKATLTNSNGKMLISTIGNINSKGSELTVTNSGTEGMHIQGHVTHNNKDGKVSFSNINSNMVIGHDTTDFNITSDADININVQDGNLLNYGVASTQIKTTDNADLNITAQNGSIGEDLGLCDGGVCTGVGPGERDLTKSINTEIDGKITADSHGTGALINIASLDKDMHINKIDSDGRVILLADDKTNKGATGYDIINSSDDNSITPNIKGSGISAIASGDIGKSDNKVTFIQTGAKVDIANEADDANAPHDLYETPIHTGDGVEFLAIGDINIKGNDNADGTKNDTNVCTIASRTGTVNAEFSGNTYIRDITAQNEVNVVNRGSEIYIENLGGAPSRYAETGDYYGMYDGIVPEKANIKALDLGTVENPNLVPNSTIVIKNGVINGKGSTSHPGLDQDVTVTADNAYVGGYYFNMGKHRGNGLSEVTKDDYTNTLINAGDPDTPVSIRGKAVRPDDALEIGRDPIERIYYYADIDGDGNPDEGSNGSGQKDDPTFDPDKEQADDLVVPEPDEPTPPGDDDDDDGPVDPGDDDDDDGPVDPGDDDDDDGPVDPGDDDDDDGPVDPGDDDDDDGPIDPGDDDDDDGPIDPGDDDDDITMDDAKRTWKKEINDNISVIDKRQYMRFDIDGNPNPVVFESEPTVDGILNISRGGVQLSHNKTLKVGDIVPVHIKYGDIEIKTEVKIVSASDVTAGGEFINLDLATANQLLYLSLLMDGKSNQNQYYANTNSESLSTTSVDD